MAHDCAGWARWQAWALHHGTPAVPAHPQAVSAYLNERAKAGLSPATVHVDRASIAAAHRAADAGDPTAHEAVRQAMRCIFRTNPCTRGQVDAVRWDSAVRAAQIAERDGSVAGLRDSALIRVGSDAASAQARLLAGTGWIRRVDIFHAPCLSNGRDRRTGTGRSGTKASKPSDRVRKWRDLAQGRQRWPTLTYLRVGGEGLANPPNLRSRNEAAQSAPGSATGAGCGETTPCGIAPGPIFNSEGREPVSSAGAASDPRSMAVCMDIPGAR